MQTNESAPSALCASLLGSQLQGQGHIWYCGAYTLFQIPLQETGVCSALAVAHGLGVQCPWDSKPELSPVSPPDFLPMVVGGGLVVTAAVCCLSAMGWLRQK